MDSGDIHSCGCCFISAVDGNFCILTSFARAPGMCGLETKTYGYKRYPIECSFSGRSSAVRHVHTARSFLTQICERKTLFESEPLVWLTSEFAKIRIVNSPTVL